MVYEKAVNFDRDLPQFGTQGGAHTDGLRVTSPVQMWVAAMDLLFAQIQADGAPLGDVVAVSGSGQQHGSVWWRQGSAARLAALDPSQSLASQLAEAFSLADAPIWKDSSTGAQCAAREAALGGAQAVATLTGSRAYERFTGNQIAKIYEEQPAVYAATERISLVSSFVASILVGIYAPIDASDGSGMNLMDIRTRDWAPDALACTAPDLREKLGPLVPSHAVVGPLHPYFQARYGFRNGVDVIAFSGDNPNSLAGLRLQDAGDIAISLGTSYTVFGFLAEAKPSAQEGHIFVNPVAPEAYMALLCYKNGALVREYVRDQAAGGSWQTFAAQAASVPPGNDGQLGIYLLDPEITPPITQTGVYRFDAQGQPVAAFAPAVECRAVMEGQCLSMRLHGARLGFEPRRILATGGASVDRDFLQIMSDVFGVPVSVAEKSDSASLGAAYRARHAWRCAREQRLIAYGETLAGAAPLQQVAAPDLQRTAMYTDLLARYAGHEQSIQQEG